LPAHQRFAGGIDKPGVALLPMGDLLNHDPRRHVAWHTGPTGLDAFHFITHTPIAQASTVLCCCPTQAKQYILQFLASLQSTICNGCHFGVFRNDYLNGLLGLNLVVLFIPYDSIHTCICSAVKFCLMQGSPLYSNYGNKSNEELILGYGFSLSHNQANFFHVMIGMAGTSNSEPGGDYHSLLYSFLDVLSVTCWQLLELVECVCTVADAWPASALSSASLVNALPNSADQHHQGTPGIVLRNHAALVCCNRSK